MRTIRTNTFESGFSREEISRFRDETRGTSQVIHLNNAGAGLMPDVVTKAITDHIKLEAEIGGYEASAFRKDAVQEFYVLAGKLLNCKPENIAFTSSATDSYTRALSSIPFEQGDVILTDTDDFISNQIQFLSLQKKFGLQIIHINDAPEGGVDIEDLAAKLAALRPRLLAITHIPTNSGLVQPVGQIAEVYRAYSWDNPGKTWYILDACQSVGQMKLDVEALYCDFLSVTARKFLRGPRGTGFLFISDRALEAGLEPLFIDMRGAEWTGKDTYRQQPDAKRFEDWEFAYALVLGTAEAIRYFLAIGEERVRNQVYGLSSYLRRRLGQIPGVTTLDRGPEQGGLVTFTIVGGEPNILVSSLLERKINVVPSFRKFAVIDFGNKNVDWALRASPHYYNTVEEADALVDAIRELAEKK